MKNIIQTRDRVIKRYYKRKQLILGILELFPPFIEVLSYLA
jgi:hypothetical protein